MGGEEAGDGGGLWGMGYGVGYIVGLIFCEGWGVGCVISRTFGGKIGACKHTPYGWLQKGWELAVARRGSGRWWSGWGRRVRDFGGRWGWEGLFLTKIA